MDQKRQGFQNDSQRLCGGFSFERSVITTRWHPSGWASHQGPLLIGPVQVAYRALSRVEARDYEKVKNAILYQLEVSSEQHFQAKNTLSGKEKARKGQAMTVSTNRLN